MVESSSKPIIRVRMYQHGLGDCFLITLQHKANEPCFVLIDCGVVRFPDLNTDTDASMCRVARDITRATGGRLDIVIVSQGQWDHVSGFLQARHIFDEMEIGEVWLPWTEDPANQVADFVRKNQRRALRGIRTAVGRLSSFDTESAECLRKALCLFGAASGPNVQEAIVYLVDHPSGPRVRYLKAGGAPLKLPCGGEMCVFVLGPKHENSYDSLGGSTIVFRELDAFVLGLPLFTATGGLAPEDDTQKELSQAFAAQYRVPREMSENMPFFREKYLQREALWRTIDNDWLGSVEQIALTLDNHANRMSLAIAFEIEPHGPVLLFPGDAQIEDWRSWNACRWENDTFLRTSVTVSDLLRRTILFKVGHRGSHNTTLRESLLELMTNPELVAMLPVCRETAKQLGWNMPFPSLVEQLNRMTRGRLLRTDAGIPDRPDEVNKSQWTSFTQRCRFAAEGLFVEYTI